MADRARKLLAKGELDDAEELLKTSFTERLNRIDKKPELAAAEADTVETLG